MEDSPAESGSAAAPWSTVRNTCSAVRIASSAMRWSRCVRYWRCMFVIVPKNAAMSRLPMLSEMIISTSEKPGRAASCRECARICLPDQHESVDVDVWHFVLARPRGLHPNGDVTGAAEPRGDGPAERVLAATRRRDHLVV